MCITSKVPHNNQIFFEYTDAYFRSEVLFKKKKKKCLKRLNLSIIGNDILTILVYMRENTRGLPIIL